MKYIIYDNTANTSKNYIDENGHNCIEEQAAQFDNREKAESVAQSLTTGQVEKWEEWASIEVVLELEQVSVYPLGDGSTLCEKHLSEYLKAAGQPNNVTCGQETDPDGQPVYGWTEGTCTECKA